MDPGFDQRFREAQEAAADALEREAWRRGVFGVEEPVFFKGEECGRITRYSDVLIMALLRVHRPQKYGTVRTEITGKDGGPLTVRQEHVDLSHLSLEDLKRLEAILAKAPTDAPSPE